MTDKSYNSGLHNTGSLNAGDFNSGDYNLGASNTGSRNEGDFNSGDFNSGSFNSGDWNLGNNCSGVFCVEESHINFFDTQSDMTLREWHASQACQILRRARTAAWISKNNMTLSEKLANPSYKEAGGYLKKFSLHEAIGTLWQGLSYEERCIIQSIPNFDSSKFKKITNIHL